MPGRARGLLFHRGMMLTVSDDAILRCFRSSCSLIRRAPRPAARVALTLLALILTCGTAAAAGPQSPLPSDPLLHVPQNLQASVPLLQLISRMARLSPTFRAQCERIGQTPGLVVRMRYAGLRDDRPFNARTIVRRHQYGAVIAEVHLYVPLDPVEIVAHEFEHLVEQIQGTDLKSLARVRGSGVVEVTSGEFETRRAVEAGRRVLAECGGAERGSVTLENDETQP
jgi:hypothetical protein